MENQKELEKQYEKVKEILESAVKNKEFPQAKLISEGFMKLKVHELKENHPWRFSKEIFIKIFGDKKVKIIYGVKNRDKTFMPRPDGVKITLSIEEKDKELSREDFGWIEDAGTGEYSDRLFTNTTKSTKLMRKVINNETKAL